MAIRWRSSMSVGIDSIDEQHKELIRRAAGFLRGLEDRSRKDVGALLSYLRTYAVAHFGEEEEAMRASEYPGYERHKFQHDRFLKDLLALSKEQERPRGGGVEPEKVGAWLESWLEEHVSRTDAEMARYLIARASPERPPSP
ncbi:MAG TPA: bacteriohemerythrin [Anaeromyxobacteraceae bacterium]|nr:bacteriohemerythrin [Anaeromyxobacteraceae bacterium]